MLKVKRRLFRRCAS